MDYQPLPFFKRGPAPLVHLSFYVMFSLALLFFDARFQTLDLLRQGISLFTHPVQQIVHAPIGFLEKSANYFSSLSSLEERNTHLKRELLSNAEALLRTQELETENNRLRQLLEVRERQNIGGRVAQILYAPRDPFSRRIVVDKGQQDRIIAGQLAIDATGVVGQVTRIFPYVSEITLITDKDQAIPVQVLRTGRRSIVFGLGDGRLELRFLPIDTDIQDNDLLVTSGLDGIFPRGLPVARVSHIERDTSYTFARIYCQPMASVENFGEVMVLDPRKAMNIPEEAKTLSPEKPMAKQPRRK